MLTIEQIDALQPGREMDILIAKQFRWVKAIDLTPCYLWADGIYRDDPPPFSTEIREAWRVIRHFAPSDDSENDYNVKLYNHGDGWTFVIYKDATHYEGDGKTPELAICRAALISAITQKELTR